jgi:hypothetical protein
MVCVSLRTAQSRPGGFVMMIIDIESPVGLDRLATLNEVRYAMSFSSQGALGFVVACDDFRKMDSDFSGRGVNLPEDIVWLEVASEMLDSKSN